MLSLIPVVQAQTIDLTPKQSQFSGLTAFGIQDVVRAGLSLVLVVAAVVFFFMLVIGGIRWILSGGDKAQTEAARNQITAALVGLVIVFAAWAIAQLLGNFFGIGIFTNLTIPSVSQ